MLSIDKALEWLCVIDPLERAQPVRHWRHCESLEVNLAVKTRRVLLENFVHDREQLLHSLIQSQVLASLDKQMIIFLVASMDCYPLRTLVRA